MLTQAARLLLHCVQGVKPFPHIMVPLVGFEEELSHQVGAGRCVTPTFELGLLAAARLQLAAWQHRLVTLPCIRGGTGLHAQSRLTAVLASHVHTNRRSR